MLQNQPNNSTVRVANGRSDQSAQRLREQEDYSKQRLNPERDELPRRKNEKAQLMRFVTQAKNGTTAVLLSLHLNKYLNIY